MRLIVFDFDGTLMDGRLIDVLAQRFGFEEKLMKVFESTVPGHVQSLKVARLLRGIKLQDVLKAARNLRFMPGAREVLNGLKVKGYITGIISDSYKRAIESAVEGLPIDFVMANELAVEDGTLTGEIRMPLGWAKDEDCLRHSVCKLTALREAARRYGASMDETIAVGNGEVDICMVEAAGLGIAFNPNSSKLKRVADVVIESRDLRPILNYA
ncbi:MAG: HAD-IB family phosphatase [Candidatus Hodarchaeaceae archaeon]|nr:HAD-IB family phosphatase [Candidatus Hodarchaeaceae archaeon]